MPKTLEYRLRPLMIFSADRTSGTAFAAIWEGLLLPMERAKTLTGLANTEPVVGAQHPAAQRLQWFLSESTWDPALVNQRLVALLHQQAHTAMHQRGVLVIDETGDRK